MMPPSMRIERDLLGERDVPAAAYYGIHTLRAVENFPISGTPLARFPELVQALAAVKQAAALANRDLDILGAEQARAIVAACEAIRGGALLDQFVVDAIQGGAGTSTNMNANEVIANRGLEVLGRPRGDYATLHPNEHVNLSQSTNDTVPTAMKIGLWFALQPLLAAMDQLRGAFAAKAVEFRHLVKVGRTQLQDAVPMTLGQEFGAYAGMLGEDLRRLRETQPLLGEINLGATAVGTGITAPPHYAEHARRHLSAITGLKLRTAPDLVEATQDAGVFVHLSGILKQVAVKLSKTCNDLRLLASGPRAGLGEIQLPAAQAGSSIMPGKVNPVIPEVVNQIAFEIVGNDVTVSFAAEAGQLQLNAFLPIISYSLFRSIAHLRQGCATLAERCVEGITANQERLQLEVERSIGIATALNPRLGYARATEVAEEALRSGRGVAEVVLEQKLLTPEELKAILSPERLVTKAA